MPEKSFPNENSVLEKIMIIMSGQKEIPSLDKPVKRSTNKFPVVGVGASAGGLAAFTKFIESIPAESGMAYVLVQHLSPEHDSLLPEILQRSSVLPVEQISDDVVVEPGNIYVIPTNKMLISNDGKLELSDRPAREEKIENLPIDLFFESLAVAYRDHAIGVVLTGYGRDGSKGLRAIRENGGITFAQNLSSSEQEAMPRNAIDEGVVDFVLPPEEIPKKILEVVRNMLGREVAEKDLESDSSKTLNQILALLRTRRGTDFTFYKHNTVSRRISRRMVLAGKKAPSAYLDFLREHPEEQDLLHKDLLIPVTRFFRDPPLFSNLKKTVFPSLLVATKEKKDIRIWVAGCSTGQEAYTIAICILEFLQERQSSLKVQIFATDINEAGVAKARSGIYKKAELEGISEERLSQFFSKVDANTYQVNRKLRELCVFAFHNFLSDPPFGRMDFISCRNVLIYMQPYLQKKALSTFHYALNRTGYLLLGSSESISAASDLFAVADKRDKIFSPREKEGKFMQVTSQKTEDNMRDFKQNPRSAAPKTDFQRAADEVILNKYTPAGVVINEAMEIVHFRGRTGAYLEPRAGKPSLNLLKMAKPGLSFELRSLLHHAVREGNAVVKEDIPVRENGEQRFISVEAIPLSNFEEPHCLVLFHEQKENSGSKESNLKNSSAEEGNRERELRIEQLENELAQAREDMRSITEDQEATNEELQSANEELQSSGEELQTLNAELETNKQELQSTNEELKSVNRELVGLNKDLTAARNFAVDVLETVREPWVVLDKHLRVKSANKIFYKVFQTQENQLERRSIFELGQKQWEAEDLKKLLLKILPDKTVVTDYEITHHFPVIGERTMLLNAREIIREEGGEKLILLVFGDITDRRIAEKTLEKTEVKFQLLVETIPQMVWITDPEGRFEYFNTKWHQYTGSSKEENYGDKWTRFIHEEDVERVIEKWNRSLSSGEPFSEEYRIKGASGKYRWFLAKALPLYNTAGDISKWFGSYTNIELQKEAEATLRQSYDQFKELAELVPEKITYADADGSVDYYNRSWLEYTGFALEELQKNGWIKFLHPDEKKKIIALWKEAVETGRSFETEMRCLNRNGVYKWHLARAIPVRDEDGEIERWVGATTEIQKIKEEEKRKEEFLQLVSHELKTPVTSVKGYVQLLLNLLQKKAPLESIPLESSLQRVDEQMGRLNRLIFEMLDITRIEENRLDLQKETFNLNKIVEETVQDIKRTNIKHKILLEQDFNCMVHADKDRIGQVIINLLTNAIKYSPDGEKVEIKIFSPGSGQVAVSFKDYGIGIAKAEQKHIFKRFHRVSGTNQETFAGLGIGLFLSHEIIERHGGTIEVESEPKKGSVFTFTLPCYTADEEKE